MILCSAPGAQAHALADDKLTRLIRIWLANRDIWDALPGAGLHRPVPCHPAEVTRSRIFGTRTLAVSCGLW